MGLLQRVSGAITRVRRGPPDARVAERRHARVLLDILPRTATVVEFGSTDAQTLITADLMRFHYVFGVTVNPAATDTVQKHLARARCDADVMCGEIATVPLPDGPLIAYLNPASIPPATLQQLDARLTGRESSTFVVCVTAPPDGTFAEFDAIAPTPEQAAVFRGRGTVILYREGRFDTDDL